MIAIISGKPKLGSAGVARVHSGARSGSPPGGGGLRVGVSVLEQPLPAAQDAALEPLRGEVLFCADESFHARSSFDEVEQRYDLVNIKLDKTGGLTEALGCVEEVARTRNILTRGTSAHRQLRRFELEQADGKDEKESLQGVVDMLIADTARGV